MHVQACGLSSTHNSYTIPTALGHPHAPIPMLRLTTALVTPPKFATRDWWSGRCASPACRLHTHIYRSDPLTTFIPQRFGVWFSTTGSKWAGWFSTFCRSGDPRPVEASNPGLATGKLYPGDQNRVCVVLYGRPGSRDGWKRVQCSSRIGTDSERLYAYIF
jgi:hypothetical protein